MVDPNFDQFERQYLWVVPALSFPQLFPPVDCVAALHSNALDLADSNPEPVPQTVGFAYPDTAVVACTDSDAVHKNPSRIQADSDALE